MSEETGFPDAAWGSAENRLSKAGERFASTKGGSWFIRKIVPLDRKLLSRSGGRYTMLGPFGVTLLLLTTTGSKSKLPRTTPLLYLHDGPRILIAGSNFGQGHHPAWSTNLLAEPKATVSIGGAEIPVTARLLEGADREIGWQVFLDAARPYSAYAGRTDRTIRVFSLERRHGE